MRLRMRHEWDEGREAVQCLRGEPTSAQCLESHTADMQEADDNDMKRIAAAIFPFLSSRDIPIKLLFDDLFPAISTIHSFVLQRLN